MKFKKFMRSEPCHSGLEVWTPICHVWLFLFQNEKETGAILEASYSHSQCSCSQILERCAKIVELEYHLKSDWSTWSIWFEVILKICFRPVSCGTKTELSQHIPIRCISLHPLGHNERIMSCFFGLHTIFLGSPVAQDQWPPKNWCNATGGFCGKKNTEKNKTADDGWVARPKPLKPTKKWDDFTYEERNPCQPKHLRNQLLKPILLRNRIYL